MKNFFLGILVVLTSSSAFAQQINRVGQAYVSYISSSDLTIINIDGDAAKILYSILRKTHAEEVTGCGTANVQDDVMGCVKILKTGKITCGTSIVNSTSVYSPSSSACPLPGMGVRN